MIFLKIRGGAGNQFAQYAFVRALINARGNTDELIIDDSGIYETKYNDFLEDHLKWYKTYPYRLGRKPNKWLGLRVLCRIFRRIHKIGSPGYIKSHEWLAPKGVYSLEGIDYSPIISTVKDIYVEGTYENPLYYDPIRDILLKEFTVKGQYKVRPTSIIGHIREKESICVSVRKWPEEEISGRRIQQTPEFYRKALNQIYTATGKKDYNVILFSNDTEFVKTLGLGENVHVEEGDGTIYEKIYAMSLCTHFVLSNSSFSWWAQYLCSNEDKVVVSPYCPKLGYFKYQDPPGGVKEQNWIILDAKTGDKIN